MPGHQVNPFRVSVASPSPDGPLKRLVTSQVRGVMGFRALLQLSGCIRVGAKGLGFRV